MIAIILCFRKVFMVEMPLDNKLVRAPEFPSGLDWLNSPPLTLAGLRGKFVLLDFWTYGCINCMHVLPDLRTLEERYDRELVVIGVHSAKFAHEGRLESLRQIVLRYEIAHPVVNDPDYRVWEAYTVRAWPTTVLVDPRGRILERHSGEGVLAAYEDLLARAVPAYDREGLLDRKPLDLSPEAARAPETMLRFPGKLLADAESGSLFVADSQHHRVLICDLAGRLEAVVGVGRRGLADGGYAEARFANPQGLALVDDRLYVADTDNHALRAVDLAERTVRTLAGDGKMARGPDAYPYDPRPARSAQLNSPWDLCAVGDSLYLAMAGSHQIWRLDLAKEEIVVYAGTGREGILDAPRRRATLAQPSGLTSDGARLFFADSEASAIRQIALSGDERVHTIIGQGLFAYGDVDGPWSQARLQHPLGIAYGATLYVADTYNHKIKIVNSQEGSARTYAGTGQAGWQDGDRARFFEPGGLSVAGDQLYVADTNNHLVRAIDLPSGATRTLELRDPAGLLQVASEDEAGPPARTLPEVRIAPGYLDITIGLRLPEGHKLNQGAPSTLTWRRRPDWLTYEGPDVVRLNGRSWPLTLSARAEPGRGSLVADLLIYYCRHEPGLCLVYRERLVLPLWCTVASDRHHLEMPLRVVERDNR